MQMTLQNNQREGGRPLAVTPGVSRGSVKMVGQNYPDTLCFICPGRCHSFVPIVHRNTGTLTVEIRRMI